MKRMGLMVCLMASAGLLASGVCLADSPARMSVVVPAGTTNAVGSGAATVSFGSGIGFRPEAVIMPATAGTTQTVYAVHGTVTNRLGSKVAAANDYALILTNAPWLFDGDGVVVSTTATNGFLARIVGTMRR